MPIKKIPGVSQGDATKFCKRELIGVAPTNPRQTIVREWLDDLKIKIREYGGVHTQLRCIEAPEDSPYSLLATNGLHRLSAAKRVEAEREAAAPDMEKLTAWAAKIREVSGAAPVVSNPLPAAIRITMLDCLAEAVAEMAV
jgi:hypothetical protein